MEIMTILMFKKYQGRNKGFWIQTHKAAYEWKKSKYGQTPRSYNDLFAFIKNLEDLDKQMTGTWNITSVDLK